VIKSSHKGDDASFFLECNTSSDNDKSKSVELIPTVFTNLLILRGSSRTLQLSWVLNEFLTEKRQANVMQEHELNH